jgi:hypothetical protein
MRQTPQCDLLVQHCRGVHVVLRPDQPVPLDSHAPLFMTFMMACDKLQTAAVRACRDASQSSCLPALRKMVRVLLG